MRRIAATVLLAAVAALPALVASPAAGQLADGTNGTPCCQPR